jgi:hypothetical protein
VKRAILLLLWSMPVAGAPFITGPDQQFHDCRVISQSTKPPYYVKLSCLPPCDVEFGPPLFPWELIKAGVSPRIADKNHVTIEMVERSQACRKGSARAMFIATGVLHSN